MAEGNHAEVPGQSVSPATWSVEAEQALSSLGTDPDRGLEPDSIDALRLRFGWNQLRKTAPKHLSTMVVDQFKSVVVLLLAAAGLLAVAFNEHLEGLAIFTVILINGTIGFLTEWRATRSMEALSRLGQVNCTVVRGGVSSTISAEQLLPGDIVLLEGGDVVTADIRLIEAAKLHADESALTGESLPVAKQTQRLAHDTRLMDRSNMVFKGTAITSGSGRGLVVGIGQNTELGRISNLVATAQPQQTPLEKRLDVLGARLVWLVAILAVLVAAAGIAAGRETFLAIEVAVALAVAAIPEGLPIVATIALARGMWRMAKKNAVIARLSAVETLGATSVILTDKTGTLTENRMAVASAWIAGQEYVRGEAGLESRGAAPGHDSADSFDTALEVATLCSNASVRKTEAGFEGVGDPTEIAIQIAALERGIERERLNELYPEIREIAFDPDLMLMATLHRADSAVLYAVKGAPEAVIPRATAVRTATGDEAFSRQSQAEYLDLTRRMGERGLRTLAVASKTAEAESDDPFTGLVLLGLFGLEDPPRRGVSHAIARCREAGVSVVMVTGDHAATASQIAGEIGMSQSADAPPACIDGAELDDWLSNREPGALETVTIFSRVSPEQKLKLIRRYQESGNVVAMTGDGVNDAPALKQADIGVAMGTRGTAVAREAAAMVLRDDELGTIAEAIAQGRAIYENIRKFVVYLLSCNISEVLTVTLATIAGAPLPLLPLQILFLNLVTDVFPALALGVGEGSPALMKRPPRPAKEPLLTRTHWIRIVGSGVVISATVLGAMAVAVFQLKFDTKQAVTVSFCTLAFAQLWHVFNMREDIRRVLRNEITRNIWIWVAIALCTTLILGAIHISMFSEILALQNPGISGWALILPMSFVPLLAAPLIRRLAQPRLESA